ncbi:rplA [Wigglesworthia glossinidia endosymbiont of Glossina brevipalpis]|uniref:Large ribosomal subunit protein uL1 n=1 Tax=Wigglesworthia glossinidia brevipalpis TaxID=36870 RepID=RL1_WIGBR|nr:RecName: Full=Large ribosomal subunit protein uL1; AltName: Full=50S ribosomal protein L1 [Wigglesworthia glossinidia endosymbiont of Glossina brevipalpis]BAC24665.1 rplA [Wigglesworthia glossinidia endosymbiont of Glossina brevipalpis]
MSKMTKKMKKICEIKSSLKDYKFNNLISILNSFPKAKFNENIDVAINLRINTKKSDQNIRGSIILPNSIKKEKYIVVFASGEDKKNAYEAGANLAGMEEVSDKIKNNKKLKIDHVISTPEAMPIVEKLGSILGPKGLMPNPKLGTITKDIKNEIKKIKSGQLNYKNDKYGIIHTTIGKINFNNLELKINLLYFLNHLVKTKPTNLKGVFIKKVSLSTTMGGSVIINHNEFLQENNISDNIKK